jgi:DNA-binding phage protein
MASIKNFKENIQKQEKKESEYRTAMLTEAVESFLSDDIDMGKAVLREYITATIGFETFSRQMGKPSKSLYRMLSPAGNPKISDLFEVLYLLQKNEGVRLTVTALHQPSSEMLLKCMVWLQYKFHLKKT